MDLVKMLDAVCPDLVDIIATPESPLEVARRAAEWRIPAICRKPLAPSLAEAEQIVRIAERARLPFRMGTCRSGDIQGRNHSFDGQMLIARPEDAQR